MSDRLPVTPCAEDRRKNSAIFRDPRIDRLVSWGIGLVPVVAVFFATYYARGLDARFTSLDAGQAKLSQESTEWQKVVTRDLESLKVDVTDKLASLRQDVALLKQGGSELAEVKAVLLRYEERILRLEREGKK